VKRRVRAAGAVMIAAVASLATACGSSSPGGSSSSGPGSSQVAGLTVRLVYTTTLGFSDGDALKFQKNLAASGFKVKVSNIEDPPTAMRALIAGQADFGIISDPTTTMAAVKAGGSGVKWVVSNDQATDYVVIGLPRYNLHNLNGATIASDGPGSSGLVIGEAGLEKEGVNTSSIHAVTIGGTSARVTAILAGRVDLAPVHVADAAAAIATGKVKQILNVGPVLGPYLQIGITASDAFISAHPAAMQTVVNDYINAARWASTNESGYIQLVNASKDQGSLTMAQEETAWTQLVKGHFWATNGGVCAATVNRTISIDEQFHLLTKSQIPPLSQWLDTTFVRNYLVAHHQSPDAC
jgi:ABC-type nitrate/sulfonate/bicarbonate transport system substrate-binding protein